MVSAIRWLPTTPPPTGRKSDDSLFDANIATFEEDGGAYNQADAAGFIKLNALRMRIAAGKGRKLF